MLDETLPRVRHGSCRSASAGSGRSSAAAATRTARYIKKDPPSSTGVTCPQCKQGELVEKRTPVRTMFYSCDRYPDCDCAVGNPPEKDHPCPECGSLLLRRPKSLRCWGCGAELDLEFTVTKSGDVEAEAAARAAKAAAQAARAAAKKKPTAKKKPPRRRRPPRRRSRREEEDRRGAERPRAGGRGTGSSRGTGGGLAARVDRRRRGRRPPRDPAGDVQGPPDPPRVLAAPRGDGVSSLGRLGRVRRGDVARRRHLPAGTAGVRDRRRDDRAHAAGDPVRADRGRARRPRRTASRS